MDKYIVVSNQEARASKYPSYEDPRQDFGDFYSCLYETDGKKPIRLVGEDGGEPEDQTFGRDWRWVVREMNQLAKEIDELKQRLSYAEEPHP